MNEFEALSNCVKRFSRPDISSMFCERIPTGFTKLDEKLGGGITSGLTVLGAGSGMGKSTFALQLGQNISIQNIPVLFFSMEMTQVRIASKAMSRQLFLQGLKQNDKFNCTADDLLNKDKVDEFFNGDWDKIDKARRKVDKDCKNLYVVEGGSEVRSSADIATYTSKFIKEKNVKPVVIVDYLQILMSEYEKHTANGKMAVDESVRNLKVLSQEKNIPVILISSINRMNYKVPISFESFKESGNIEYTADVVLGLQFKAVYEASFDIQKEKKKDVREVELSIIKQRYGQAESRIEFDYYPAHDCFIEETQRDKVVKKTVKTKSSKKATATEGIFKGMSEA